MPRIKQPRANREAIAIGFLAVGMAIAVTYWWADVDSGSAHQLAHATSSAVPTIPPSSSRLATTSAKPGQDNTGVPKALRLTDTGGMTITQPNQVIDGMNIAGAVVIRAAGVTIRNSKIHGTDGTGVSVLSGSVTVMDSEIYGFENGIGLDHWSAYRVNIHGTYGDGVKLGSDTLLQDSWIHDLTPAPGAPSVGVRSRGGRQIVDPRVLQEGVGPQFHPVPVGAVDVHPVGGPVVETDTVLETVDLAVHHGDAARANVYAVGIVAVNSRVLDDDTGGIDDDGARYVEAVDNLIGGRDIESAGGK